MGAAVGVYCRRAPARPSLEEEMKKLMLSAAVVCATLAMPALAFADDMSKGTTTADAGSMMICRQAAANEKPVAMMADNKTGLVCKTITADMMAKMKAKQMGPDLSKALTSQQVDDAWRVYLAQMFAVPGTGGG